MRRFLLSIILILALAVPILAHPGRTDGSGGHYDHDTGEYHYHHGYGPHDHEDLDGDGDLDCPYNFEDKTGEDSGESSGSTTRYPAYTRPTIPPVSPRPTVPAATEPTRTQEPKGNWLEGLSGALIPFWFMLGFVLIRDVLPYLLTELWSASKPKLSNIPTWYIVTVFVLIVIVVIGLLALAVC